MHRINSLGIVLYLCCAGEVCYLAQIIGIDGHQFAHIFASLNTSNMYSLVNKQVEVETLEPLVVVDSRALVLESNVDEVDTTQNMIVRFISQSSYCFGFIMYYYNNPDTLELLPYKQCSLLPYLIKEFIEHEYATK